MKTKSLTAERPTVFDADVLARYRFASKHCRGKKVLDVGTGFGFGANYLVEKGATKVIGVDYDKNAVDWAKSNFDSRKLTFFTAHVEEIDKTKNKFDVVIAFEIIEHLKIEKVNRFIESLYKILKPGGILLLTTPNGRKTEFVNGKPYNPYHIKEYRVEELNELLSPLFRRIKVKGLIYKNIYYLKKQRELKRSPLYKIAYFFGHYKLMREIIPFIPKTIREKITGENNLPEYIQSDFLLLDEYKNCPGLFIYAQKTK